jgi:hypothetical protein
MIAISERYQMRFLTQRQNKKRRSIFFSCHFILTLQWKRSHLKKFKIILSKAKQKFTFAKPMAYGNSFYLIRLHKTGIFQTRLWSLERFLKALSSVNVFLSDEIIASGGCTILLRSFQRTVEMLLSIHCYATKVPDLVSLCIQWYAKKTFWKYLFNKTLLFLLCLQAMAEIKQSCLGLWDFTCTY